MLYWGLAPGILPHVVVLNRLVSGAHAAYFRLGATAMRASALQKRLPIRYNCGNACRALSDKGALKTRRRARFSPATGAGRADLPLALFLNRWKQRFFCSEAESASLPHQAAQISETGWQTGK